MDEKKEPPAWIKELWRTCRCNSCQANQLNYEIHGWKEE